MHQLCLFRPTVRVLLFITLHQTHRRDDARVKYLLLGHDGRAASSTRFTQSHGNDQTWEDSWWNSEERLSGLSQ